MFSEKARLKRLDANRSLSRSSFFDTIPYYCPVSRGSPLTCWNNARATNWALKTEHAFRRWKVRTYGAMIWSFRANRGRLREFWRHPLLGTFVTAMHQCAIVPGEEE
jgi:hypothetical protein